ncbi:MAG TPA: hypothetical protein PKG52_08515 [bacterium]|nr:hypothetical protein [bacterium]HPS29908.1 hypothetical protein [bacterium]
MKIKLFFFILLVVSLSLNIFWFSGKVDNKCLSEPEQVFLYPVNESSLDYPISHDPESPRYTAYTLDGNSTVFLSFNVKGTIPESVEKKYGIKLPIEIIRNIQEIVYFLNDYKIRFYEGDRISMFYRESDMKIVYLRFKSARRRSISEIFLFNTGNTEKYVTSDGSFLQPCITNGPFENCPEVRFITENDQLIPVFNMPVNRPVRLPFLAKYVSSTITKLSGGEAEFVYSNYAITAVFKGLGSLTNLDKVALYKKDAVIGKSGYIMKDKDPGLIYYLRKKDNTIVSPYVFHHTEKVVISEKEMQNLSIMANFFSIQYELGHKFENKHY